MTTIGASMMIPVKPVTARRMHSVRYEGAS